MYFVVTIKPSSSFPCVTSLTLMGDITDVIILQGTNMLALEVPRGQTGREPGIYQVFKCEWEGMKTFTCIVIGTCKLPVRTKCS